MREGHSSEKQFGMDYYSTDTIGIGGKIKTRYEDFLVEEISTEREIIQFKEWREKSLGEPTIVGKKSRFVTFTVQKMGISTMDMSTLLAAELKLPRNLISYAGLKDKRAVTVQQMSMPSSAVPSLCHIQLSKIELRDFLYTRQSIQIGDLWGNRFTVLVRDHEVEADVALESAQTLSHTPLLNYFGIQRFGLNRPNTHLIGKYLILRDYEQATRIMLCTQSPFESEELRTVRIQLSENLIPTETMIAAFPRDLNYERNVMLELLRHPGEFERALKKIPPRVLTLMIHAYQSYLFNRLLSERAASGLSILEPQPGDFIIELDKAHSGRDSWLFVTDRSLEERLEQVERGEYGLALQVPGYATRLPSTRQTDMLRALLKNEGVTTRHFRNPRIKALDSPGGLHLASILLDDLRTSCSNEGLQVSFSLRKGSYATVVLRELMKNHPINRV